MTTLNKAIRLKEDIEKAESQKSRIHKLYAKKEDLSSKEITEIIELASDYNSYVISHLKSLLQNL